MEYDKTILRHYADVAAQQGDQESCTMDDQYIRQSETAFILDAVKFAVQSLIAHDVVPDKIQLLDAGCGNGFTLSQVESHFPALQTTGVEFSPELMNIANKAALRCTVKQGDVRQASTLPERAHIVVLQRVLINLLDGNDQAAAVENLTACIPDGGFLITIEAYEQGWDNLNRLRSEFNLEPIPPAHHNLYLSDSLFRGQSNLSEVQLSAWSPQFLSSHYVATRLFHELALTITGAEFTRNSMFVKFLDDALPPAVGNYSPLEFRVFQKHHA